MLGPVLFNIFIIDKNSTFIIDKNSTRLSGAADATDGRDAIQRDPDGHEKQVHTNLMKFNRARARSCTWVRASQAPQQVGG